MPNASGRRNEHEGCQTDMALKHRGIRVSAAGGVGRRGTGWHGGDKYRRDRGRRLHGHFGQRGVDSSIRHTGPSTKNGPSNRSEERRVGKECRSRWSADQLKKKENRNGR